MDTNLTLADAAKMVIAEAKDQLVLNEKQLAVIEAAKAFYVERQEPDSGHSIEELTFWQAVRALLAAEGEA